MHHKAILYLKDIPRGRVVTYKELARVSGTSPRAVGRILGRNQDPVGYPCYKVVASNGELCGYSAPGGLAAKRKLLLADGVAFTSPSRVNSLFFYTFPF